MTLFFFLRLVGDLSLFYAVANAFLCMTSCDVAFLPLIVLSLCGALAYFTAQKKEALRFLPILLMPLALIGVEDLVTALIILASAIYVADCIRLPYFPFHLGLREAAALCPLCPHPGNQHAAADPGAAARPQGVQSAPLPHRKPSGHGGAAAHYPDHQFP